MNKKDTSRASDTLHFHDHIMRYLILPFIPSFVTPNAVSIFRIVMTPLVLWFIAQENYHVGIPLFLFVSFTDAIDGSLARVRKQVTDVGKLLDPLADKLLIGSVVSLIVIQHLSLFLGLIILGIEIFFIVGAYYWYRKGIVVQADVWGKIKMCLQVFGVLFLLIGLLVNMQSFFSISAGTFYISIVFAIVSLFSHGV